MENLSFIFTIFFMLLGPVKIIPAFAAVTKGADSKFKKSLTAYSLIIAVVVSGVIAVLSNTLLSKYHISVDGLRIAGGLVLLIAALKAIFNKPEPLPEYQSTSNALKVAVSPMVTPVIIPPAGVAAILLFMMLAPGFPGMVEAVAISLGVIMILNFLVMYFNDRIIKAPGLMLVLQLLGSILVFMQVALGIDTILDAFKHMQVIKNIGLL